jgi:hypothetical protein
MFMPIVSQPAQKKKTKHRSKTVKFRKDVPPMAHLFWSQAAPLTHRQWLSRDPKSFAAFYRDIGHDFRQMTLISEQATVDQRCLYLVLGHTDGISYPVHVDSCSVWTLISEKLVKKHNLPVHVFLMEKIM